MKCVCFPGYDLIHGFLKKMLFARKIRKNNVNKFPLSNALKQATPWMSCEGEHIQKLKIKKF